MPASYPRALLGLALLLAACNPAPTPAPRASGPAAGAPRPKAGSSPPAVAATALAGTTTRVVPQQGRKAHLSGSVSIVANNGTRLHAEAGTPIVSNNGGGLVANVQGLMSQGKLVSQGKWRLNQAPGAPATDPGLVACALADATIEVRDARGRVLVDDEGRPLVAVSDRRGAYVLDAVLPDENVVLAARLFPGGGDPASGGELSAMVARGAAAGPLPIDLDTASSVGSAYVLDRYVASQPEPQPVYDKLPAAEAARLHDALAGSDALTAQAPRYQRAELIALAEDARSRDVAVDEVLTAIRGLLIGQVNLGDGQRATAVPLGDPRALTFDARGRLLITERLLGRIRAVAKDEAITTFADAQRGEVKQSFYGIMDVAGAPDGAVYIATASAIFRATPDGQVTRFAGSGPREQGQLGGAVAQAPILPAALAVAPDGTLYVLEHAGAGSTPPRVLAIAAEGVARALPFPALAPQDLACGLTLGPDGSLYVLAGPGGADGGQLHRWAPGMSAAQASPLAARMSYDTDIAGGPDGTIYVADGRGGRVSSWKAGETAAIAGPGAPAGTPAIALPVSIAVDAGGTLFVADATTNLVHARDASGRWTVKAGRSDASVGTDLAAIPVNAPAGLAYLPDGRLVFSERGAHRLRAFDGQAVAAYAGEGAGPAVPRTPLAEARFTEPGALAFHAGALWLIDRGNGFLRRIGANGTIDAPVGRADQGDDRLQPEQRLASGAVSLHHGFGLAIGPDGLPYWSTGDQHQICRLAADGLVEAVAGTYQGDGAGFLPSLALDAATDPRAATLGYPMGLAFRPGASPPELYFVDAIGGQVRRIVDPGAPGARLETVAGLPLAGQFLVDAARDEEGLEASQARFSVPLALAFGPSGDLYVSEGGTGSLESLATALDAAVPVPPELTTAPCRVRVIDAATRRVSTIAGPRGRFLADAGAPDALKAPAALALDERGHLALVDIGTNLLHVLPLK